MSLGGKPRAVEKVRVVHAELLRPLVHACNKGLLAAGKMFAERDRCVVAGNDAHGFDEVFDTHLLALFEPDLTAAHRGCVSRACDGIVIRERAGVDGLHREQQRHHLRDARALARRVLVLGVEHGAGLLFHQESGGGVERELVGAHRHAQKQRKQQDHRKDSFHGEAPFFVQQRI